MEKNNYKKRKKKYVGKHHSNLQCFKEKNYKVKFSTSFIFKKIKSPKIILKKKEKRKEKEEDKFEKKNDKKNMWRKLKLNSQHAQY